jgi:hypothetical protein
MSRLLDLRKSCLSDRVGVRRPDGRASKGLLMKSARRKNKLKRGEVISSRVNSQVFWWKTQRKRGVVSLTRPLGGRLVWPASKSGQTRPSDRIISQAHQKFPCPSPSFFPEPLARIGRAAPAAPGRQFPATRRGRFLWITWRHIDPGPCPVPDPDSPRLNHLYITYITCMGEILFYTNTYS